MLSSGALERHIQDNLIPCYSARYHAMIAAIKEHLEPLGVQITTGAPYSTAVLGGTGQSPRNDGEMLIAGGFFLLITLPRGYPPASVLANIAIEQHQLKFAYGKMFEVKGDEGSKERSENGYGNTIRLCSAFHKEDQITEGIKRMKDIMEAHKVSSSS